MVKSIVDIEMKLISNSVQEAAYSFKSIALYNLIDSFSRWSIESHLDDRFHVLSIVLVVTTVFKTMVEKAKSTIKFVVSSHISHIDRIARWVGKSI